MKERHKAVGAVYVIMNAHVDQMLMMLRENTGFMDHMYGLPSGHVEAGESPRHAAKRELEEELSIIAEEDEFKFVHVQHRLGKGDDPDYVDYYFELNGGWIGTIRNKEPGKCGDLYWSPRHRLPPNTVPYIKKVLDLIRLNVFYSEHVGT